MKTVDTPSQEIAPGGGAGLGHSMTEGEGSRRVRSGKVIVTVAFIASLGAIAFALATRGQFAKNMAPKKPAPTLYSNASWKPGTHRAPGIGLVDQTGKTFHLAAQRGKIVVVTFMDSSCTTLCPLEGATLEAARQEIPASAPVELVVVSTDPPADTPAATAAFAARFGWSNWDWHWVRGGAAQMAKVWHSYGIGVQGASAHTSAVFIIDKKGYQRLALEVPFPQQFLASDLIALQGQAAPAHP